MSYPQASVRGGSDARTAAFRVWTVVGLIIIGIALLNVFGVLAPVIEFLAVGSLIAFVASPIVNSLEHRGVSRGIGSLVGLVVVLAVIACVVMVIVPIFTEQVMEILTRLPGQLRMLGDLASQIAHDFKALSQGTWASDIDTMLSSLADAASRFVTQLAGDVGKGMVPFISQFASQIFVVFLALVLAYWLARDYPVIHREIGTIVGEDRETSYRFMIAILSSSVGGYMRGMIITSFVGGLLAFIGFVVIGHPYAALMGVVTGLFHLIPVIGPCFSSVIACLLAFFTAPMLALWTLIVTVVAQNVTDNIVSPKVMQSAVQVHPAMSLTALVVGSSLMGALGMVVAIPLCAALKGLFVFYFEKETKRQLVAYDGAIFKGTPFRNEQGEPVPAFDALGDDRFVVDSELIDTDSVPEATALPKPELDNPWARLASLQPGATGVFRNPFAQDTSDDAEQDDGR
ncbi:AI-2E family transporter [Collinsella phocaeensis]|uniref:AI-2E family transporter n=1 Tax=Collinsella phocaeensis TaxID=1871016 RepID=UPI0009307658|nr:AI-2E family transporter [Collinsella phocaeensis]